MKLLLFGGTFDPPHNGHVSILESCIAEIRPDLVVIEPSAQPPHKAPTQTPAALRAEMCRTFLSCFKNTIVDDFEIRHGGKSYTIDTVRDLKQRYPDAEVYLCVGSDMLLSFTDWKEYRALLCEAVLVTHLRSHEDDLLYKHAAERLIAEGAKVVDAGGRVLKISSTDIRAMHTRGESICGLVPADVYDMILTHKLYREGERYRVDYSKGM